MPSGRKKKHRNVEIDFDSMLCDCFWPIKVSQQQLQQLERIVLYPEELQSMIYQDIENLTMDQASSRMGVSKTVYSGIYKSARAKIARTLTKQAVLLLRCSSTSTSS